MRFGVILLAGSLALCTAGCRRAQQTSSVALSGMVLSENPVGPIPGAVHVMHYSHDPYLTDPVGLQDGRRLFDWYNCSGCHGGHAGGGMGPSLRDPVWLYGDRDDQIFDSIAEGRSEGMPAWGSKIPELQIWELVAYIKSMGTPLEPDPPVEPVEENVGNPEHNSPLGIGTQTRVAGRP